FGRLNTVILALTWRILKKGEQSRIIRRVASPKVSRQVSPMAKVSRSSPGLKGVRSFMTVPSAGKKQRIKTRFARVFSGILLVAACRSPATGPSMSVYVVDEFARVRQRDVPGTKRAARLSAARNEYAPFQIIVRAGNSGLKRVQAAAGPLVPIRGRA